MYCSLKRQDETFIIELRCLISVYGKLLYIRSMKNLMSVHDLLIISLTFKNNIGFEKQKIYSFRFVWHALMH